jgi:energy-coupling factor transport system permease protein
VLAPLVVRKPGAALFAEMVAAGVSAFLGSAWGADTLLSGFVQGAAAELVFAFTLYRVWTFPVLAVAAVASAAAAWIHDWVVYYSTVDPLIQIVRGVAMAISAIVLVAGGSLALHRALKRAGVLEGFPD